MQFYLHVDYRNSFLTFTLKVILKLEESQLPEASQLTQYHIK